MGRMWMTALASCAVFALASAAAGSGRVDELIGPDTVRSFASASAQASVEPSVALVSDPASLGAPPAGFGPLPEFSVQGGLETVTVPVGPGVDLYGTGFQSGPMERTGRRVEYYNLDNFGWGDSSNRNYQTHPWVIGVEADGSAFGVLFDSTWASSLDTIDPVGRGIVFQTEGPAPRVITVRRDTPMGVVRALSDLTGRPFMPPMWSVGYHQSKYSYTPQSVALSVAQEFRTRQIPAEVIWMDIDYMDGFRNFTFNPFDFPDPALLNSQLDGIGFQAVWMANCGIKVDPGYSVYDEVVAQDLAVKDAGQVSDFLGDVWPGLSVWPDFTMSSTRSWWAGRIASFASIGVDGIWNDMNEPAVFNVPSKTMPDDAWHRADASLGGPGVHRKYHNIYGMQMSRATRDGMLLANPNKRPFVLTRAGYIGGQRYAAMWTGDNVANWYHVDVSVQNILNIGMSGQPNCGPDIGGFNGDSGGPMYARWMGIGALMPFARGHYGFSSIDREPWSYGPVVEDVCRLALNRRYRLLNYFYTQFWNAHETGEPVARPAFFAEPGNERLRGWDDGFLVGPGLLVAGATWPGAEPQVPPMETPIYRFGFPESAAPGAPSDLNEPELPDLYVVGGHIVIANDLVQSSGPLSSVRDEAIELVVGLDENGQASGLFYEDEGDGFDYLSGDYTLMEFTASYAGGQLTVDAAQVGGSLAALNRPLTVRVPLGGGAEATWTGTTGALPASFSLAAPVPDGQPPAGARDGRLVRENFGSGNLLAVNDDLRYEENSQLRALYAEARPAGLEIGLEGELAIDGTAVALFIDADAGGQQFVDLSALSSPPSGLPDLSGSVMDDGFTPEWMLFANAFDGSVFCDWVSLSGSGSKTYLGRQFLGSGGSVLTGGNNWPGLEVSLGSAGPEAGSGFEVLIPWSAIGGGTGPCNEIRVFAKTVKPWGQVTNQAVPAVGEFWASFSPDFRTFAGRQFATLVRAVNPDRDGSGVVDVEDLYAHFAAPTDINDDAVVDGFDAATLKKRIRAGELVDVAGR